MLRDVTGQPRSTRLLTAALVVAALAVAIAVLLFATGAVMFWITGD